MSVALPVASTRGQRRQVARLWVGAAGGSVCSSATVLPPLYPLGFLPALTVSGLPPGYPLFFFFFFFSTLGSDISKSVKFAHFMDRTLASLLCTPRPPSETTVPNQAHCPTFSLDCLQSLLSEVRVGVVGGSGSEGTRPQNGRRLQGQWEWGRGRREE